MTAAGASPTVGEGAELPVAHVVAVNGDDDHDGGDSGGGGKIDEDGFKGKAEARKDHRTGSIFSRGSDKRFPIVDLHAEYGAE